MSDFDIRGANGIAVVNCRTVEARRQAKSCRRKEVHRTKPDAWHLKDKPRRGPVPQEADAMTCPWWRRALARRCATASVQRLWWRPPRRQRLALRPPLRRGMAEDTLSLTQGRAAQFPARHRGCYPPPPPPPDLSNRACKGHHGLDIDQGCPTNVATRPKPLLLPWPTSLGNRS